MTQLTKVGMSSENNSENRGEVTTPTQNGAWVNPPKVLLSLLITITEVSGESLPRDVLSVALVNKMFQNAVGIDPLDVEIYQFTRCIRRTTRRVSCRQCC